MTRENTAPLFFVNRLQESCKKFKDGEAIFYRSAVRLKSTLWNKSFSDTSAIILPLLHL